MSANNQTLIKEYKGRWLIFENVNAESWDEVNTIKASKAVVTCKDEGMAYLIAELVVDIEIDRMTTEYGVSDHLVKDGTEVKII